ncbi:MAG: hypothetical protein V4544_00335 [Pseudomonadota bacterium]
MKINFYFKLILVVCVAISHCFSNAVNIIETENTLRCSVFNTIPNHKNEVHTKTISKDKNEALVEYTTTINTILIDQNRVSKRHAELNEKKIILQAVMGSIIVHDNYPEHLLADHDLLATNELYKHFEILRLTQEVSKYFSMRKHENAKYNLKDDDYGDEYKNLYIYSGLTHDMLCDWFNEIYKAHTVGITTKNEQSNSKNNNLVKNVAKKHSRLKSQDHQRLLQQEVTSDDSKLETEEEISYGSIYFLSKDEDENKAIPSEQQFLHKKQLETSQLLFSQQNPQNNNDKLTFSKESKEQANVVSSLIKNRKSTLLFFDKMTTNIHPSKGIKRDRTVIRKQNNENIETTSINNVSIDMTQTTIAQKAFIHSLKTMNN